MEVIAYTKEHSAQWDLWCSEAVNGTFLATRHFLSYHGDRFQDASVLIMESDKLVGVFPAAISLEDNKQIVSHPGATFGGVVHNGWLSGNRMIEALGELRNYYQQNDFDSIIYKAIPYTYSQHPSQDDLYALFRLGAKRVRSDLACTINLKHRRRPSSRRRRNLKKALKVVTLNADSSLMGSFWEVLVENLARKHGAKPVHSLSEIQLLKARFPNEIQLRGALIEGELHAGIVLFNSPEVWHAQYIATSEDGNKISALDAVFDAAVNEAVEANISYFDFGTSNEDSGRVLNDGLYRFKSEFGGGGVAHEFYQLDIS
ncbi:GNAT family N-acetyltransferase [Oceanicoccus sp. KOV_DT_Chl]|uniref:GNAT family N-acetyltransferase n=1 Tax=Oceanicoccus sp. KOV_DT_Chl TaxID=1904639 RepID=UPI000C7B085D|nr:GNAT family N-acetyltransferase [Oceanicoccus sp. KOV_DT_Chl]